jgi:hypothetical protein
MTVEQKNVPPGGSKGTGFGRPPKPAELIRSERVVTFVTPKERETLQRLSHQWQTSISGAIHRLMRETLEADFPTPADSEEGQP